MHFMTFCFNEKVYSSKQEKVICNCLNLENFKLPFNDSRV